MGYSSFSVIGFRFYRICRFYRIMRELKKSSGKMLPPVGSEPRHSDFHVLHATAWANFPICLKDQPFRSLCGYRLLDIDIFWKSNFGKLLNCHSISIVSKFNLLHSDFAFLTDLIFVLDPQKGPAGPAESSRFSCSWSWHTNCCIRCLTAESCVCCK